MSRGRRHGKISQHVAGIFGKLFDQFFYNLLYRLQRVSKKGKKAN